jgi:23S rRNA pseudouridine2605 synthase
MVHRVRLFALHKPRGVLVSRVAEGGTATVWDLLAQEAAGFVCVGRLDKDSEGLLLFCDDTRVAQRLMDPGGIAKTYLVTTRGFPREEDLAAMRLGGAQVDGRPLLPVEVRRIGKAPRGGTRLEVVLHEGRNRQIRRLFQAAGCKVRRLVRTAIGPITLGGLAPGETRELAAAEVDALLAESERQVVLR